MRGERFRLQSMFAPEAPRLWQKMANVEEGWIQRRMSILMDYEDERAHQMCSLMWVDNFWIMSHSKKSLQQMLCDLFEDSKQMESGTQADEFVVDWHV